MESQTDPVWSTLAKVAAGLTLLAGATAVVRAVVAEIAKVCARMQDEVRSTIRKRTR